MKKPTKKRTLLVVVILLVALVAAGAAWWFFSKDDNGNPEEKSVASLQESLESTLKARNELAKAFDAYVVGEPTDEEKQKYEEALDDYKAAADVLASDVEKVKDPVLVSDYQEFDSVNQEYIDSMTGYVETYKSALTLSQAKCLGMQELLAAGPAAALENFDAYVKACNSDIEKLKDSSNQTLAKLGEAYETVLEKRREVLTAITSGSTSRAALIQLVEAETIPSVEAELAKARVTVSVDDSTKDFLNTLADKREAIEKEKAKQ